MLKIQVLSFFAFNSPCFSLDDNLPSKPPMIEEPIMVIKKTDVKKHLAAKRRKYHTALALESMVSANPFKPFGSSIKPAPAPAQAVAPVSTSKST